MKLQNMQGKPLLVSTDGKGCNDYWVTVPMRGPEISLPRLSITGNPDSSIINEFSAIHQSICHEWLYTSCSVHVLLSRTASHESYIRINGAKGCN